VKHEEITKAIISAAMAVLNDLKARSIPRAARLLPARPDATGFNG